MAPNGTDTNWDHEYNLIRRQDLFRNPPTDHTAYPLLQLAVDPHIESFNAIFLDDGHKGLIDHGLDEIGTKTYLDGEKNRLTLRCKRVTLQKSMVPPSNKFAKNREILPAECRERHVTYRGKLMATFEYRINSGDLVEFDRELGQLPIMVKVSHPLSRTV